MSRSRRQTFAFPIQMPNQRATAADGIVINKLCTIGEIQKKLFASAFAAIVTRLAHSAIFGERGVSAVAWPADKQRSDQALRFQATVALKSHMGSLTKVSSPFAVIVKTK